MMPSETVGFVNAIGDNLPYLRRYARALTGSQKAGDSYAAATLESVLEDTAVLTASNDPKVALFHAFHLVWGSAGAPADEGDNRLSAIAQKHMARLSPNSREALLLSVIEEFTLDEIAIIMEIDRRDAAHFISVAIKELEQAIAGKVMIIEDEAIIALNLSQIVQEMGHTVTGVAATRAEAVELAARERPDLVLADIQLADQSSGIDAVNDILAQFEDLPVIFITAYPERLLTGSQPEPTFIITKPFREEQVYSAVSQAMFFSSVESLDS